MNFKDGKTNEDWRCDVCSGTGIEAVDGSTVCDCTQCDGTGIWDELNQETGSEKGDDAPLTNGAKE